MPSPTLQRLAQDAREFSMARVPPMGRDEYLARLSRLVARQPLIKSETIGVENGPPCFWRGRICDGEELFSSVGDLMQPPLIGATSVGRCHEVGDAPPLYTGTDLHAVIAEIGPKVGDIVQIVGLRIAPGRKLVTAHIGEIDHVRRFGRTSTDDPSLISALRANGWVPTETYWRDERLIQAMLIDGVLAEAFSKPAPETDGYIATSVLARSLFHQNGVHGVVYPSVKHRGGVNVAFHHSGFPALEPVQFGAVRVTGDLGFGLIEKNFFLNGGRIGAEGRIEWPK